MHCSIATSSSKLMIDFVAPGMTATLSYTTSWQMVLSLRVKLTVTRHIPSGYIATAIATATSKMLTVKVCICKLQYPTSWRFLRTPPPPPRYNACNVRCTKTSLLRRETPEDLREPKRTNPARKGGGASWPHRSRLLVHAKRVWKQSHESTCGFGCRTGNQN